MRVLRNSAGCGCVHCPKMRLLLAFAAPVLCLAATCESPFTATVKPGSRLKLDIHPANIEIRGAEGDGLRVTCEFRDRHPARDLSVSFKDGELKVAGPSLGKNDGLTIRVDVPRRTDLHVRSAAGNLTIRDVTGEKDVELRAGNIEIFAGPNEYRSVELSARVGNIEAPSLGIHRSGFLRSHRKSGLPGQYSLTAHVTAGNVTVR